MDSSSGWATTSRTFFFFNSPPKIPKPKSESTTIDMLLLHQMEKCEILTHHYLENQILQIKKTSGGSCKVKQPRSGLQRKEPEATSFKRTEIVRGCLISNWKNTRGQRCPAVGVDREFEGSLEKVMIPKLNSWFEFETIRIWVRIPSLVVNTKSEGFYSNSCSSFLGLYRCRRTYWAEFH